MLNQETAKAARTDSGYILRAPRRMRVADAVAQYMRVPMGAGNSVPWDPLVAPYVIEPMNCLASREYDAVIFVGPARTGKTIGLIDGWVIYNVICDPADMLIIQMTEEKAREHSKKRLARTFRVSPEVVSRLSPNKNDNTVYDSYTRMDKPNLKQRFKIFRERLSYAWQYLPAQKKLAYTLLLLLFLVMLLSAFIPKATYFALLALAAYLLWYIYKK